MNQDLAQTVLVPDFVAVTIGLIVFFLGAFLTRNLSFLQTYNIPEPVSGGLAAALITGASYAWLNTEIAFELSTRDELLVIFFTIIGINARFKDLVAGGQLLMILLAITIAFIALQNVIGLVGTRIFDLPQPVEVLLGSASLIGGHGTAIAWGPTIQEMTDFAAAEEIGVASATLGLVSAALIGRPIAKFLIDRHRLVGAPPEGPIFGLPYEQEGEEDTRVNHISLMRSLLAINVAIILGYFANEAIAAQGLKLPLFVSCLVAAILMSNTVPLVLPGLPWPARTRALAVISDYSLSVFLACR